MDERMSGGGPAYGELAGQVEIENGGEPGIAGDEEEFSAALAIVGGLGGGLGDDTMDFAGGGAPAAPFGGRISGSGETHAGLAQHIRVERRRREDQRREHR